MITTEEKETDVQSVESLIKILTKSDLIHETERLVSQESMGYSEAIISICDNRGIEPEDIAKMISETPLKDKLRAEAQRNNLLPKPNSLF